MAGFRYQGEKQHWLLLANKHRWGFAFRADNAPCLVKNLALYCRKDKHSQKNTVMRADDLGCAPAGCSLSGALICVCEGWPRFLCWVCCKMFSFLPVPLNAATWQQTRANINTKLHEILMRNSWGKGSGKVLQSSRSGWDEKSEKGVPSWSNKE